MSSEPQRNNFTSSQVCRRIYFCCCYLVIHGQKSISNPAADKWQGVHLHGMKQLLTKVTPPICRKPQLIRVRRSRRAYFWPNYCTCFWPNCWSTCENSAHSQHLIINHRQCQQCNQMLRETSISSALFIIWNKVIQFVQWGRWWSLTELFLQLPKWGLNGKHGASRVFLYVKASVKQRWLRIRDVNLLQIGRFQFNKAEFHIHYWTQAFSFHCYYKCLDKI